MSHYTQNAEIRLGIVGCGGFAGFAVERFLEVDGVRIAATADIDIEAARRIAQPHEAPAFESIEDLVARRDVDLVYIATPPFLHYPQGMAALNAGKHVIVEKPLAVSNAQGEEMSRLAAEKDLLLAVNLMQRYNPLFDTVKQIVEDEIPGKVLNARFENLATDAELKTDHWFWDPARSGGIFIEHGVHFFDLIEGWLGPGEIESASFSRRPSDGVIDQVRCSARHGFALVDYMHSFTQASVMDRQELRIVFERGDLTLFEWVPTRIWLRALADAEMVERIQNLLPDAQCETVQTFDPDSREFHGHGRDYAADRRIEAMAGADRDKMRVYGDLLRSMMADQVAWIRDRSHVRRVTEANGVNSLAMAVEATRQSGAPLPA